MSTRNVEPDTSDRPDALPGSGPGAAQLPRAVQLALVEGANVLYGYPEALFELRGERFAGLVNLYLWNLDLLWPDAFEAFGVFEEGLVSPVAHVMDDPACCVTDVLGEKATGAAQLPDDLGRSSATSVYPSNQGARHSPASRLPGLRPRCGAGGRSRGWRSDARSRWRSHRVPRGSS